MLIWSKNVFLMIMIHKIYLYPIKIQRLYLRFIEDQQFNYFIIILLVITFLLVIIFLFVICLSEIKFTQ